MLDSWGEAVEHCASLEWENLGLEAANRFRRRLVERSVERFRRWNEIVEEVKRLVVLDDRHRRRKHIP